MSPDHDPLSDLLRRLDVPPPPPPGIAMKARARAAQRLARRPGLLDHIDAAFARPSFAGLFVVGCVLLGLFTAEARISRSQAERTARLERSYLELIDPLVNTSK